jgi:hypothetical protein
MMARVYTHLKPHDVQQYDSADSLSGFVDSAFEMYHNRCVICIAKTYITDC